MMTDHELLAELAPLGRSLAETRCCEACRSYHAVWGFKRLYGISGALMSDAETIREVLAAAFARGARRILVSGAADAAGLAMIARVAAECGVAPSSLSVVVADLCETPLAVNRRAAALLGMEGAVRTVRGDILTLDDAPVDLVIAHNILSFFPPEQRAALAAVWARHLRPGGELFTVSGLWPEAGRMRSRFRPDEVPTLVHAALERRAAHPRADLIDPDDLAGLMADFVARQRRFSVASLDEVTGLLSAAGLTILRADSVVRPGHGPAQTGRPRAVVLAAKG